MLPARCRCRLPRLRKLGALPARRRWIMSSSLFVATAVPSLLRRVFVVVLVAEVRPFQMEIEGFPTPFEVKLISREALSRSQIVMHKPRATQTQRGHRRARPMAITSSSDSDCWRSVGVAGRVPRFGFVDR